MNVLYLEDNLQDSDLTRRELSRVAPDIQLKNVGTVAAALAELEKFETANQRGEPLGLDLLLLDLNLPDGSGLKVLTHARQHALPLAAVVLTGSGDEESVLAALRAGANDYLTKRHEYWVQLPSTLRAALENFRSLNARHARPLRLLYVEPNESDAQLTRLHFNDYAPFIQLEILPTGIQALARLPRSGRITDVDVILLDYRLPGLNALEVIKEILQVRKLDVPILIITGHGTEETAVQATKLGAMDYIVKSPGYLHRLPSAIESAFYRAQAREEQAKLLASEKKFRLLIENGSDLISVINHDGFIRYKSPSAERLLGYTLDEMAGHNVFDFIHEEDKASAAAAIQKAIADPTQTFTVQYRLRHRDGTWKLLEGVGRNIPEPGSQGYLIFSSRDITERKRVEIQSEHERIILEMMAKGEPLLEVLERLALSYETIFPGMLCSILLLDADGKHLKHGAAPSLPPAFCRKIDGVEIGPAVGSCGTAAYTRKTTVVADIANDPLWRDFKELALTHGLRACWSVPILSTQGKVHGTFAFYHHTPRRAQPEELAAVERGAHLASLAIERYEVLQSLQQSEQRFRQLAENIQEVFWITEPAGNRLIYVSPAYEQIWARTCESLYRAPETWLEAIHPEDRQRITQAAQSKKILGTYDEAYRIVRPDGSIRWIRDSAFCVRDAKGNVTRIVGVARDITERRQLEEQFRQSQKMEAIGQLAGGVAHDFNNILAVIQMQADLLKDEAGITPSQLESAAEITKAAQRAADLTRQLLLFGRRQAMQPRQLNLNEVVTNMAKMLQRLLGEHIQIQYKLAAQTLFINADAGMMDQILLNLAVNSRDAMPKGGKLVIETSAVEFDAFSAAQSPQARPGLFACLSVSDTGVGIPPEILPRIFEPFFTTKEIGKGTGLGLATIFGITQQHQGWINAYSEVGQGTTFRTYLPRITKTTAAQPEPAILTSEPRGNETILLAEDEISLRVLVRNVLTKLGYHVLEAASGTQALRVWEKNRDKIHLLLTDIVMPDGMTGIELAQQLQKEKPSLKVIYTSGYSIEVATKGFPLKDGVDFLPKPFPVKKLARIIRDRLDA
jgi:PAS domain S-box-containing protein